MALYDKQDLLGYYKKLGKYILCVTLSTAILYISN